MSLFDIVFGKMIDRRIAAWQNELVERHYDEVQNIYRTMRGWRHDYHNHIQTMKVHLSLGQTEELADYLGKLDTDLTTVDTVLKTGNVMVDAILNSKMSLIKSKEIAVNAKATVPKELSVSEVDLCVIIGNLLDNAMEACLRQEQGERFIRIYIGTLKGQLYISVSNSAGEVTKSNGHYLSSKQSASHGFGLIRIDRIVDKYEGYVNRQNEEGVFATEVMLPL
ncbi:MAG: GHKL domain-containing protein [Lachnospiraceae bacterium]|nr:GHKL domain-containing protein [Lachnospiraceae bacterium]